jgi:hypothetical protein
LDFPCRIIECSGSVCTEFSADADFCTRMPETASLVVNRHGIYDGHWA